MSMLESEIGGMTEVISQEYQKNFVFYYNVALHVLFNWLDLLVTKKMIAESGLGFEANERAKELFVSDPLLVDTIKIFIIPALVFLLATFAHKVYQKLAEKRGRETFFEKLPTVVIEAMNISMALVVFILLHSKELSNLGT